MQNPTDDDWAAVKQILRYLKATLSYGLHLLWSPSSLLSAYSDPNWARCPDDHRSTSGYCVSWAQPYIMEFLQTNYNVLIKHKIRILGVLPMLHDLGLHSSLPPVLWCDNLGAPYLAANPIFHARTNHIKIDFHLIREKVENKNLDAKFILPKYQLAHIFSKGLSLQSFTFLRDKLNVQHGSWNLRRHIVRILTKLSVIRVN